MTKSDQELGRRERNKLEKQARIFDAAAELFAEKGYSAVTTQEIADRADVAGGTLFRYAASKAELLLMVYNAEYRKQIELGEEREAKSTGTEDRVLELVSPLLIASRRNDENTGIYQREVLFGEPSECFRAEGLELSQRLQTRIAQILLEGHPNHTTRTITAARTISNVLHFEIARAALDRITADELTNIVAAQVRLTLAGLPTEKD
ncbi:TetR/AcrR family transcriptional regulator [Rhodococcus sp. WS1]|uniref:TetR/AcrR family transcriptional regulator n=1 Tax=Rhodococcus TaxID=1827 RepID=UPI00038DC1BE|nr:MULTISPECIES: TetR/AcrR family transcriptional regulator [Rhodococcus]AGT95230.1 TetR family transcriptional regulator [Rhodococcus erythropolis CCM2595]ROZ55520.1 TetR/AcrR family transcriptional regulator [Rhodococcus sp. WS1]TQC39699.1 TetR/AcrR family transcriptional regulator [Rhodococcus sp. WS7]SUE10399.1 putative TetR family transcriptional regulator [Rhodococcus erythropolis]